MKTSQYFFMVTSLKIIFDCIKKFICKVQVTKNLKQSASKRGILILPVYF